MTSLIVEPTEKKFPSTPFIPSGYFAELPDFATKVQELVDFFNPDEKEELSQEQNKIQKQKAHLTTLLENLKLSQNDYDFYDYEQRLLLSDAEIENILETEIFRKNGELTELGKGFYEYLELLTEGKIDELKGKMKRKLVKELKLEDRVFENSEVVYSGKDGLGTWIEYKNKEHFFQDIQQAGISGIKSLDLGSNNLAKKLETPDFLELVKQAGISGIKSLDLGGNYLSKKLEAQDFIELVKQSGLSGIKSLNLSDNYLSKKLDVPDFIELVKQAGISGIKSLDLGWNNLSEELDVPDFLKLVKHAGLSGIKSLDLSVNSLSRKLNDSQKQELDNIAKQYNMKLDYSD